VFINTFGDLAGLRKYCFFALSRRSFCFELLTAYSFLENFFGNIFFFLCLFGFFFCFALCLSSKTAFFLLPIIIAYFLFAQLFLSAIYFFAVLWIREKSQYDNIFRKTAVFYYSFSIETKKSAIGSRQNGLIIDSFCFYEIIPIIKFPRHKNRVKKTKTDYFFLTIQSFITALSYFYRLEREKKCLFGQVLYFSVVFLENHCFLTELA
jgi:hypothetical protein